jgi:hypothetical protein
MRLHASRLLARQCPISTSMRRVALAVIHQYVTNRGPHLQLAVSVLATCGRRTRTLKGWGGSWPSPRSPSGFHTMDWSASNACTKRLLPAGMHGWLLMNLCNSAPDTMGGPIKPIGCCAKGFPNLSKVAKSSRTLMLALMILLLSSAENILRAMRWGALRAPWRPQGQVAGACHSGRCVLQSKDDACSG